MSDGRLTAVVLECSPYSDEDQPMTEFDLALDFLQNYVRASAAAAEQGESIDDRREFQRHCEPLGVEPTPQRMELVRDMAGVVKECLADDIEAYDSGDGEEEAEETQHLIPASSLAAGLERYGWRIAYLNKDVRT